MNPNATPQLLDISAAAARTGVHLPTFLSDQLWQSFGGGPRPSDYDPRVTDLCWSLVTALVLDALSTQELVERPRGYVFAVELGGRQIGVHAVAMWIPELGTVLQLQCNDDNQDARTTATFPG